MAPPPVSSSFKSQELGANHRSATDDDLADVDDMEGMEEFEAEEALMMDEEEEEAAAAASHAGRKSGGRGGRQSALPITVGGELKCSVCDFTTRSRVTLQRHERLTHLKKKFFRCGKCNYVTHVKARYTKHVKYHSMPMIKCDLCEFRTPYKWNLDRHLKNHMGGGMYQCSLCNFTAHIKQSLTVHIQNHHLSPDKARSARRRYKVGASDQLNDDQPSGNPMADAQMMDPMDPDELELLRLERMEHDARLHDDEDDDDLGAGEDYDEEQEANTSSSASVNKVDPDGFLHPDEMKNGDRRVYLRHNKSGWPDHPSGDHHQMSPVNYSLQTSSAGSSPPTGASCPAVDVPAAAKKARPIPNLIPIAQSVTPAPPTILKIPQIHVRPRDGESSSASILEAVGLLAKSDRPPTTGLDESRKRKSGFLDQLAQKLAGNNEVAAKSDEGHSSTSSLLSAGISWSSRCQHCRQRCKTRADLLSHLKQCPRALEAVRAEETASTQPHPMENKVFVWNQSSSSLLANEDESNTESETDAMMMMMLMEEEEKRPSSVAGSDVSEASLVGVETAPGIGAVTGGAGAPIGGVSLESRSTVRRVYRCPQCSFWATTASRFHVHMVGHTNTKPFECSQCAYRSNWRWDITKHIKLKAARDPAHTQARVLLLDASGERHYDQYDRYLVMMRVTESGGPSLTHGRFAMESEINRNKAISAASSSGRRTDSPSPSPSPSPVPSPVATSVEPSLPFNLSAASLATSLASITSNLLPPPTAIRQPPALNAIHDVTSDALSDHQTQQTAPSSGKSASNPRRTIWKCKRCIFKHKDKRMVLAHMAKHTRRDNFSCGLCGKGSNWQSVIRRHCRLKHNGNIQVIENRVTDEDGPELSREGDDALAQPLFNGKTEKMGKKSSKRESPLPDEDSMGYMMHPDKQQYSCATCPFICKSLTDIELHRQQHKAGPGRPIKCPICPFYVSDKHELNQHLILHGMHDMKFDSAGQLSSSIEKGLEESESSNPSRRFRCNSCPYVSDNKSQYVYHKQFHRPRGAPYKCSHCSYNVSRRHLLNQHLGVHGLAPVALLDADQNYNGAGSDSDAIGSEAEAEAEAAEAIDAAEAALMTDAAPSGSSSAAVNIVIGSDGYTHLGLDPNTIARLPDSATVALADIPLTWVSRGQKFYKMFKCRHCPHVNVRKANIQEHEKRHQIKSSTGGSGGVGGGDNMHACSLCNYRCNNAGVLSAHVKVHQHVLGIIHALADASKSDEEQLLQLAGGQRKPPASDNTTNCSSTKEADRESCSSLSSTGSTGLQPKLDVLLARPSDDATKEVEGQQRRRLHFCDHCPARFLVETELLIHQRFHGLKLAFRCDVCSYTARQENHLLAHWKVHSREYQERTKALIEQHGVSDKHPQPQILAVQPTTTSSADDDDDNDHEEEEEEEEGAIDLTNNKKLLTTDSGATMAGSCSLCPAKFGANSKALQYHVSLHGSGGPFRCRFCNYAVKAQDNLNKHERLHLPSEKNVEEESASAVVVAGGDDGHKTSTAKRYQCLKCPSSFEKKEQFKVHSNLHGSKQRYRCDRCDYAVKYYANYMQHIKRHDEEEESTTSMANDAGAIEPEPQQTMSTADRQQIWLQDKLRRPVNSGQQQQQLLLSCQYCPFKSESQEELGSHVGWHAINGATGSYRCNFCDFIVTRQEDLSEHIGLHFQLKGRKAAVVPESYWKCSNLEIWSEPVTGQQTSQVVYDEKADKDSDVEEEDDEDTLYIDLSTGHPA